MCSSSLLKCQWQFLGPLSQSSSFEESCPSNVGISWSKDVVRFASLSVACKVSVYACIVVCMGSSLGWGGLDVIGVS